MRIMMMTNTYSPIVGGLERSIQSFSEEFRKKRHKVLIVAPKYAGMPKHEEDVLRVPAIQKFSGTDFSVNLSVPGLLPRLMKNFKPDIVHSHHPFLMGDIALRLRGQYHIPVVFTYHIMFEHYVDYLPIHNETVKNFIIELSTRYANLVDHVIVPSSSVLNILVQRGVNTPIDIIPTGVNVDFFARGDGTMFRQKSGIPPEAFVIGYVGRLTPEKNLKFLSHVLSKYLKRNKNAHCLIVGKGPLKEEIANIFLRHGVENRLHLLDVLEKEDVVNGYQAMDLFAFCSHSETQGMVLLESMASGVPVVAADAPPIGDFVRNYKNGRLIHGEQEKDFVAAVAWYAGLSGKEVKKIKKAALSTAKKYSMELCANRLLDVYEKLKLIEDNSQEKITTWQAIMGRLQTEIDMLKNVVEAGGVAVKKTLAKKK